MLFVPFNPIINYLVKRVGNIVFFRSINTNSREAVRNLWRRNKGKYWNVIKCLYKTTQDNVYCQLMKMFFTTVPFNDFNGNDKFVGVLTLSELICVYMD